MTVLEIIGGILLVISSILIVLMVMMQESEGKGMGGTIQGDMPIMTGRVGTRNVLLAKYTKYAAVVFFVVTILVNVFAYRFK